MNAPTLPVTASPAKPATPTTAAPAARGARWLRRSRAVASHNPTTTATIATEGVHHAAAARHAPLATHFQGLPLSRNALTARHNPASAKVALSHRCAAVRNAGSAT